MPDLPPPVPPGPPGSPASDPSGTTPGGSATGIRTAVDERSTTGPEREDVIVPRPPRVGDLTTGWRIMMIAAWTGVFLAFAGVWKASIEIGIRTWWIGPRSDPRPVFVQVIPFVLAIGVALAATYNVRRLPWIGVAGALAVGLVAVFDISRSGGLALVEGTIGAAALLVALASFGGRYRRAPSPADGTTSG
jgi:hypothetical protein